MKNRDSMYTEEDKAMANDILGLVRRNSMVRNFEIYREMNRIYKRNDDDFSRKGRSIWKQLIALGLMNEAHGELTLTEEGIEAYDAEGGIQAYFEGRKKSKKKDEELKDTTIWNNRVKIVVGITSILSFIAGVLLSSPIKKLLSYILGIA